MKKANPKLKIELMLSEEYGNAHMQKAARAAEWNAAKERRLAQQHRFNGIDCMNGAAPAHCSSPADKLLHPQVSSPHKVACYTINSTKEPICAQQEQDAEYLQLPEGADCTAHGAAGAALRHES